MIVDFHTHVFPEALAPAAMESLEEEGDIKGVFDATVPGLIGVMDRAGVDVSVTQPVATRPSQVRTINDWAVTTRSARIVPFGAMHPDLDDPAREIERMRSAGLPGFKLHPDYQRCAPDDGRMGPILQAASAAGMVVLFHAGYDLGVKTSLGTPEAFAAMLARWPGVKVVIAHMGGFREWDRVARHLVGLDVFFDTAYTLGHLPDEDFLGILRSHGADRVLFGSDGPWTDPAAEMRALRALGLDDEELEAVLGGNARSLLLEAGVRL